MAASIAGTPFLCPFPREEILIVAYIGAAASLGIVKTACSLKVSEPNRFGGVQCQRIAIDLLSIVGYLEVAVRVRVGSQ